MGILDVGGSATALFAASQQSDAQRGVVAQRNLLSALDLYGKKQYDAAIARFQQAIAYAPSSETAVNAYNYMAAAYVAKEDLDSAIQVYKKSLTIDPRRVETLIALGNTYFSAGRPEEAQAQYEAAVKLDPSPSNYYALGQAYLKGGQYELAERQFAEVKRRAPDKAYGDFGLGQAYAKQGRLDDAVEAFQAAVTKQRDYWAAYAEMGYVLVDKGDIKAAQDIALDLAGRSEAATYATLLGGYILEKSAPKMLINYSTSTFLASLGPGTPVALMASELSVPNGSQLLTMVFQFDAPMDPASVENVLNWRISRSTSTGRGDGYNFDFAPPPTEIELPNLPTWVVYDREKYTATVYFRVSQNATANGTIDPSHIKFSFNGVGANGVLIDPGANDYTGFSGFT